MAESLPLPVRIEAEGRAGLICAGGKSASGVLKGTYPAAEPDPPTILRGVARSDRASSIGITSCVRRPAEGNVPAH
ncbi:hypothetical protein [Microvirga pudoricolor]|uniref:hypothetical protein n=1 Tax=Microvirga pudoricolor TaxID=2778729 RepID=UPI00194DD14E|nr:hypothetical protein [Microvirga pudoricolor]MBM6596616.1 hypothetical protein [Microvirga pudoricolor]